MKASIEFFGESELCIMVNGEHATLGALKKCDNVIVGDRVAPNMYEILLDDKIELIEFRTVNLKYIKFKMCSVIS